MSRSGNCRVYVGNLSSRTRESDLEDVFRKYGRVLSVDIKAGGYGFIEFDDSRDAEDAVRAMNGRDVDGRDIMVQAARGTRRGPGGGLLDRGSAGGPPPRSGSGYRLVVSNLATRTSWQDLKDFARSAGNVRFTDVWNERGKKYGIIEYTSRSDYEYALKTLDDKDLDGVRVRVDPDEDSKRSRSRSRSRSRGRRSRSRSRSRSRRRSPSRSRSSRRRSRTRSRSRGRDRSSKKDSRSPSRGRSSSRDRKRDSKKDKDDKEKREEKEVDEKKKDDQKDDRKQSRSRSRSKSVEKKQSRSRSPRQASPSPAKMQD